MIHLEDEQLAAFVPGLDAQFRARCLDALRARGKWSEERVARAVDTALSRAGGLGLSEERSVLGYVRLAVDIVLSQPEEHVVRSIEAILKEPALPEWQRLHLAIDYFRQMREPVT